MEKIKIKEEEMVDYLSEMLKGIVVLNKTRENVHHDLWALHSWYCLKNEPLQDKRGKYKNDVLKQLSHFWSDCLFVYLEMCKEYIRLKPDFSIKNDNDYKLFKEYLDREKKELKIIMDVKK